MMFKEVFEMKNKSMHERKLKLVNATNNKYSAQHFYWNLSLHNVPNNVAYVLYCSRSKIPPETKTYGHGAIRTCTT